MRQSFKMFAWFAAESAVRAFVVFCAGMWLTSSFVISLSASVADLAVAFLVFVERYREVLFNPTSSSN